MRIKGIVIAVAAVVSMPAAWAQQPDPVTLYGRVFGSVQWVDATGARPVDRRTRVEDESSRFGVRGTEDLGGGLKAFFQFETVFRIEQNNSTFAARNSAVGLQGAFGSLLMGRWDSPYKVATYVADPFELLTLAGDNNIVQDSGNFGRRAQNVIQYWTPTVGGFSGRLAVTANEGKAAGVDPRDVSASIGWADKRASLSASWEKHFDQLGSTPIAGVDEEGVMLVGTYTVAKTKFGGIVEQIKKTGRTTQKNLYVSIVQEISGPHSLIGTYGRSKDGGLASDALQPESKAYSATYQYTFSKRTMIYGQYARIDNNGAGVKNFPYYPVPGTAPGSDPRGFAVGMRHLF